MRKILLKIRFDGTNYCGWQVQPNGITVQQVMCEALSDLLSEKISVTGCSRTDSGVHANEFCCHFTTENDSVLLSSFPSAINVRLPKDIAVLDALEVDGDFHARYSVKSKRYIYKMYCSSVRDPFLDGYALRISKPLDLDKVNDFCKGLVGTHDFEAFSASGKTVSNTVRTIYDCSLSFDGNKNYVFSITGDGFLYNMVRIIVGTAIFVSEGKINPADVESVFLSRDRSKAGPTVLPYGLYLDKINY